jgi:hypothetical protein
MLDDRRQRPDRRDEVVGPVEGVERTSEVQVVVQEAAGLVVVVSPPDVVVTLHGLLGIRRCGHGTFARRSGQWPSDRDH